ncbi:MAG: class I adenylate-forming enzyme family protein [Treponema sp.]|nr:acyl--CoA ligase [Spirochaetia bacterium]MDD7534282.1 class I adenylate-forming enzyme family protein [Treponema sp.]MDY5757574.1 class I adenylate-forming enzyme family protein [Treponema sp.]
MPITKYLESNAEKYADDCALVELNPEVKDTRRMTWKEFDLTQPEPNLPYRREISWRIFNEKANRCAHYLLERGVRKGDKVGILLMNCLEWLPIYFGILKTGALAVPLNFRYASDEIDYCLNLADISVLFFGPEFIGRLETISEKIMNRRLLIYVGEGLTPTFSENYISSVMNYSSENLNIELTDDDEAAIYFSSGTTGFPKAILHKHRALMHSAAVEQQHHGQTKDDVFLCIPPLYHTGAKMHWFGSLISGSKTVLLRGTKPEVILKAASDELCTIVWLLVPWAQDILDSLDRGDLKIEDYHLSQWRLMHIGAQPVPKKLIEDWKKYFPHHAYDTNYGLSESIGPGCVHLGVGNDHKIGAIGIPGYGWKVKIVDEHRKEVKQGDVGELAVFGPGVMVCYYKNPEATNEVMDDEGWLYTGDMAMMDPDGFIYLVDRKKDVIITGGENLYPVQIEDFLHKMEAIKDVAVIGLADKRLGEIAAAIIEVKQGYTCTEEDVNNFCLELPKYKRPRKIIFAPVPRNPTGKIEKPKLREMYRTEDPFKVMQADS